MSPIQDLNSLLVISGNQYWRPIQTCSFEDLKLQAPSSHEPPPGTDIWWFANEARAMAGGTYSIAFLFVIEKRIPHRPPS